MSKTASIASAIEEIFGGEPDTVGVRHWLDTGYAPLNMALTGRPLEGLPSGRIVQMYGDSSSGKTVISVDLMIAAQKAGGLALFMDHERTFMKDLAEARGLNMERGRFSLQYPRTFEESITKAVKWARYIRDNELVPESAPLIVVFDSLNSMVPQSKMEKELDELKMNDKLALAASCSSVFPALTVLAEETDCLMLFLDQIRQDPGVMFGDNTKTSGGKAPGFYSTIRIALSRKVIKKDGAELGQSIVAKIVKNKVGRPFLTAEWDFLFDEDGSGFLDRIGGMVDYLVNRGIIAKAGAYLEFKGKKVHRGPLVEALRKADAYTELLQMLIDFEKANAEVE
ncbi:recombinase [Aeromonas caviae]|jgi:recombination protein RecA|uniref:recombinase n=1 Tax=Aeromonas TaxID=642 RepID=UPI000D3686BB|nr:MULTISPECIES: recombinase [Aeromonas]BCM78064.1 recombinase [Aeromonas caviae]GJC21429.1 recombinase [Aeromonas caviae]